MNKIAIVVILWVAIMVIIALFGVCRKWRSAYYNILKKYENLKKYNSMLERDVYRLTFKLPKIENGKAEKDNDGKRKQSNDRFKPL